MGSYHWMGLGIGALTLLPIACDGDDAETVCTLGEIRACVGPGECYGTQTCNADGTSFGPCECGTGGSGGTGGTGATGGTGGTGGAGGDGGAPPSGRQPPPRPSGAGPGDGSDLVLAVETLFLGGTDWSGTPYPSAWELYGYDLDGVISTAGSTNHCQPNSGASPTMVRTDGADGVDNSFGDNMLPVFTGVSPDFETEVNGKLADGEFTLLLKIDDLGASADYDPLVAKWYLARDLGSPPAFDGSDSWPIAYESLSDPFDVESAHVWFGTSYLTSHVFVAHPATMVRLQFVSHDWSGGGTSVMWTLDIHHAVITTELATDRSEATHGIIAGVLDTEEFVQRFMSMARHLDTQLCPGSVLDSIVDQIRQVSDIMADGTQNPNETCDGISIGLGFTATPAQLGSVATPYTAPPDPC